MRYKDMKLDVDTYYMLVELKGKLHANTWRELFWKLKEIEKEYDKRKYPPSW